MARFEIVFKWSVAKDLRGIPNPDVARILARIEALQDDPRPPDSRKLSAQERYRIRQGIYRILYEIRDAQLQVVVVKVGHRREAYRHT
jgi:mRNA interferase RelE/StbE